MSNLPLNSLQEGEHNLQEMKTKSPARSSKGYHMYELSLCVNVTASKRCVLKHMTIPENTHN